MVYDFDLPMWKWPFYAVRHPFMGFEDVRWRKGYSMKASLIIVLLFFVSSVTETLLTGFIHKYFSMQDKVFNIIPYLSSTILLFFVWVIANWALCTLFDGEGTMKNICCVSAYSLIPYIASSFICTFVSNFLTREESTFIFFISIIGLVWSVIMMISGMKVVHQYSMPKTILSMIFTILAMVIILFIAVLMVTMFQQVFVFIYSIYTELLYRFSL